MYKYLLLSFLLLHTAVAATPARQEYQDPLLIKKTVNDFVQQQTSTLPGKITFQIDELDSRLTLASCSTLEAFLPAGARLIGKAMIGVRCKPASGDTHQAWRIFVPVQIRQSLEVLVSARQLPLGHPIEEQDIASQSIESTPPGTFTEPAQVLGQVLRYSINAGQVLRADMLRPAYSITQGQIVQLSLQSSNFSIRYEGVALGNATEGQNVQIRVASGRVVSGIARAGGIVEIAP